MQRVGLAFRIIWRTNVELIWRSILSQREACDRFLKNTEGVSLIISSITGMVGKLQGQGGKAVYPGIAYWVVLSSLEIDPRAIVRNIQAALQGQAEVKLLQEPPVMSTIETMQNTLCTVMKDHSNSYVKKRLIASQAELKDTILSEVGNASRFVTLQNELDQVAIQARLSLQQGGILVDIIQE